MLLPDDDGHGEVALPAVLPLLPLHLGHRDARLRYLNKYMSTFKQIQMKVFKEIETNLLHVVLQLLLEALHGVVEVLDLLPQVEVLPGQSVEIKSNQIK